MHNANQPEKYERLKRQTDKALNKIRLYYQMGLTLLKQHPLNSELKQLYEPLNSDTQAKIRRFANPDKGGYTKKQLEELLKLVGSMKSRFHWVSNSLSDCFPFQLSKGNPSKNGWWKRAGVDVNWIVKSR